MINAAIVGLGRPRQLLEEAFAQLEGGARGLAFASGMAAPNIVYDETTARTVVFAAM